MLVDVVASLPFEQFGSNKDWGYFIRLGRLSRISRILKLARLFKIYKNAGTIFHSVSCSQEVLHLLKCGFVLLLTSHMVACGWYFLGTFQDQNWVTSAGLEDEDLYDLYIASLYWTVMTLTTTGYGDITAYTQAEQIFSILVMMWGVFLYSYIISSLFAAMHRPTQTNNEIKRALQAVVHKYDIGQQFYQKLKTAIDSNSEQKAKEKKKLLAALPPKMSNQITAMLNRDLISLNFFFQNKQMNFVLKMLEYIKEYFYLPLESVIKKGDAAEALYFVMTGELNLFEIYNSDKIVFEQVNQCDYFGDVDIFLYSIYQYHSESRVHSSAMLISKSDLLGKVLPFFQEVADELILEAHHRDEMNRESKIAAINRYIQTRHDDTIIAQQFRDLTRGLESERCQIVNPRRKKKDKLKITLKRIKSVESQQNLNQFLGISDFYSLYKTVERLERTLYKQVFSQVAQFHEQWE